MEVAHYDVVHHHAYQHARQQQLLLAAPPPALPEAYVWSPEERGAQLRHDDYRGSEQLPVVDMAAPPASVAAAMVSACREWGAFHLLSHDVPPAVVDAARAAAARLFALPAPDKHRAARQRGSLCGYGATRMADRFAKLMWSESFTMRGSPDPDFERFAHLLFGGATDDGKDGNGNDDKDGNGNDDKDGNGNDGGGGGGGEDGAACFVAALREYDAAVGAVARQVAGVLLAALATGAETAGAAAAGAAAGAAEAAAAEAAEVEGRMWGAVHMNWYPPCPAPQQAMGLAAHTDSSCITIMHQGEIGGLQLLSKRGEWIAVRPRADAFVVQVGDMLQVMSNDAFRSVVHRAVVNDKLARLSLVYFLTPSPACRVAPILGRWCSSRAQRRYRPLTWRAYLQAKSKYFTHALRRFAAALRDDDDDDDDVDIDGQEEGSSLSE